MNDETITELFSAYLDGELTADEQLGVEHLLSTDPSARQLLDELRAIGGTLQALPQQKVGEDLSQRVLDVAARRMLVGNAPESGRENSGAENSKPSEAASGDQDLKPLWKELSWRGLFSSRALAWSGIAVAVAILINWYDWQHKPHLQNVAINLHVDDDKKSNDKKSVDRADAAPEMPKAGEVASAVSTPRMIAKTMNKAVEMRKAPEMSSADAPAGGRTEEGRVANRRDVAADAVEAETANQAGKAQADKSRGVVQQQAAPREMVEQQGKDRDTTVERDIQRPVASRGSGGRWREQSANDSAKKLAENLPKDAKAQAEGITAAEKPTAAPLNAPMAAAAPAEPTGLSASDKSLAGKPSDGKSLAAKPATAKGEENKRLVLADQSLDAKRVLAAKTPALKEELAAKKSDQGGINVNGDRIVVRLDITRQAANDGVFERLLSQHGLFTQSHDLEKASAPTGGANLNLVDSANVAGVGGGLSQAAPTGAAANGNLSNGSSGAGGLAHGNTAYSGSTTIYSQNGTVPNGTMQNGMAQSGMTQNFAIQNDTQSHYGGQNRAPENAVRQNAAPALTPSQLTQNLQVPANLNTTDNMNLDGNSGATVRLGPTLGPAPRVVEVDANAAQIADLRKALVGNHIAFPSVSFPSDVEQLGRFGGGKEVHAPNLKQGSGKVALSAPQSYTTSNTAAKSSMPAQAPSNLTHVMFECWVVDPAIGAPPASNVFAGTLQPSASSANTFQPSGTGALGLTGTANYQFMPSIATPAPASPAAPAATTPSPASKQ